jgi:L-alanine-DL-glutamate epimerase-like enolase superfamily enzyme
MVKAPGSTKLRHIASVTSAFGDPIMLDNIQPTISTAVHLYVCADYSNIPYAREYYIEPISIRDQWPIPKTPLQLKNGYLEVPDGLGLGVELD